MKARARDRCVAAIRTVGAGFVVIGVYDVYLAARLVGAPQAAANAREMYNQLSDLATNVVLYVAAGMILMLAATRMVRLFSGERDSS